MGELVCDRAESLWEKHQYLRGAQLDDRPGWWTLADDLALFNASMSMAVELVGAEPALDGADFTIQNLWTVARLAGQYLCPQHQGVVLGGELWFENRRDQVYRTVEARQDS